MESLIKALQQSNEEYSKAVKSVYEKEKELDSRLTDVIKREDALEAKISEVSSREEEVAKYNGLEAGMKSLNEGREELAAGRKELNAEKAKLNDAKVSVEAKQKELDTLISVYKIKIDNVEKMKVAVEEEKANMKASILEQIQKGMK